MLIRVAGMASEAVQMRLQRIGQGVLQPAEGLAALGAVLQLHSDGTARPTAQLAVNSFNWSTYLPQLTGGRSAMFAAFAEDAAPSSAISAIKAATQSDVTAGALLNEVISVLKDIVGK